MIDKTVIESAYGWTLDEHGELLGLVNGDMGYEKTGIKLGDADVAIWRRGVKNAARLARLRDEVERLKQDTSAAVSAYKTAMFQIATWCAQISDEHASVEGAAQKNSDVTRCEVGNQDGSARCECHRCIAEKGLTGVELFGIALPLNACKMIVCGDCGNKRCPKASDHGNACTGSNDPGQPGSIYR